MFIGYETLFLYLSEHQKHLNGDASAKGPMDLDHALGLRIQCGQFSFAEMGRAGEGQNYAHILGVTGTLDCLGEFEKRIVREYGIVRDSLTPSIYGENRMKFKRPNEDVNDNVEIVDQGMDQFHQAIQLEMSKAQRDVAVLVFFETEQKQKAYLQFLEHIHSPNVHGVTGDVVESISHYVKQATRQGTVQGCHRL